MLPSGVPKCKQTLFVDNSTLPVRIKEWLNARGITDEVIVAHQIGWNGTHIVIPIPTNPSFNKYRRDPASDVGPKYTYDTGGKSALYTSLTTNGARTDLIICEGELDVLALESKGFIAWSSTGGAGTFREEWAMAVNERRDIEVYALFDNDDAGRAGAIKVCRLIPHAKFVPLPPEVGEHGDVTDFFVKLGKTAADLDNLLAASEPLPPEPPAPKARKRGYKGNGTDLQKAKAYPMGLLFGKHEKFTGHVKCPIHGEKTESLKIYKDNRWYCYGACAKGGDVVDFVMLRDSLTMPQAIKKILSL